MTSVEDFCLFSITIPELESWVFAEIFASEGLRLELILSSLADMAGRMVSRSDLGPRLNVIARDERRDGTCETLDLSLWACYCCTGRHYCNLRLVSAHCLCGGEIQQTRPGYSRVPAPLLLLPTPDPCDTRHL